MNQKQQNIWVRRFKNLPHSTKNIAKMVWHPVSNYIYLVFSILKAIVVMLVYVVYHFFLKEKPAYSDDRERNILILLACLPMSLIFAFKNQKWATKYFFPLIPKLGLFLQHKPDDLSAPKYLVPATQVSSRRQLKLAVVTPSYGQGVFIKRTLDSVLDQGYPSLQYVVQDGGSKDSTIAVLSEYRADQLIWESVEDNGQTDALNKGYMKLDDDWDIMCYLNSDDLLLPNSLDLVMEYFNDNPDVDVVYGNRLMVDENDQCIGEWIVHEHNNWVLSYVDYVPQETMFWRRSIWDKSGACFDDSFRFAMDWDLILRFRSAGANFRHIPFFLGAFRIHQSQKTQAMINEVGDQEMWLLRERSLGYKPDNYEIFANMLPYLLRHTWADFRFRYL